MRQFENNLSVPVVARMSLQIFFFIISLSLISFNQSKKAASKADKIFEVVDEQPEFIGGSISSYLSKNMKIPKSALRANVTGRLFLSFVVNTNGKVSDIKVLNGVGFGFDDEAIRVLKSTKWKPGRKQSKAVRVKYNLPINIELE